MKIYLHKSFRKQYQKLGPNLQKRFKERRALFLQNPFDPLLRNHALTGKYKGYRSINITGDLRVIYEAISKDEVMFTLIDTHSNLYG